MCFFLAQSVTSVGRPMLFMAARLCLSSLSGRWVRINKRQITATLGFFGFIVANKHLINKAGPRTYASYLEVFQKTDRFVDILNGNYDKGCSSIDSPNHPLLFELLDYVKWLHQLKRQSRNANNNYLFFCWVYLPGFCLVHTLSCLLGHETVARWAQHCSATAGKRFCRIKFCPKPVQECTCHSTGNGRADG